MHPRLRYRRDKNARKALALQKVSYSDEALKKQWELYKTKKVKDLLDSDGVELYRHRGQRKQNSGFECFMEEEFHTSSDEEELQPTD